MIHLTIVTYRDCQKTLSLCIKSSTLENPLITMNLEMILNPSMPFPAMISLLDINSSKSAYT